MTQIAVTWRGRSHKVDINLLRATTKDKRFQKELDTAVSLFPPFPTYDCENWMAANIMQAFGGGTIHKQPKQSEVAMGDLMMGDQPI